MAKVGVLRTLDDGKLAFICPGCGMIHAVNVDSSKPGPCWGFNDDYERPTFTPSILVKGIYGDPPVTPENFDEWRRAPWPQRKVEKICHSFVTDGQIQFLGYCTHELAGKTVPIKQDED